MHSLEAVLTESTFWIRHLYGGKKKKSMVHVAKEGLNRLFIRSFLTMYISMFNNTVNTEASRKYKMWVRYVFLKLQNSVPNKTRDGKLTFRRLSNFGTLEENRYLKILVRWTVVKFFQNCIEISLILSFWGFTTRYDV